MVYLLQRCRLVLTDSGGLQKEACFFQKPCVTLREETEWVELIEHGFNILAGSEKERILRSVKIMLDKTVDGSADLYGAGHAGMLIVKYLLNGQE